MRNWLLLSDAASIRCANSTTEAEVALNQKDDVSYQLHYLNAIRYHLISKYCLLRARRMFSL